MHGGRLSIEQLVARLRVGNLPTGNLPERRLGGDVSHIEIVVKCT